MFRVTADTNVLVSGLNFRRGKPFQLLELAREGLISLTVSQPILNEVADVLQRKFGWTGDEVAVGLAWIGGMARTVQPTVSLSVITEDPPDNRILECAVTAGSDFLITGDQDLLRLGSYDSIRIVTVANFLELLASP